MTMRRAMELLMVEMACVKRGSGMEYDYESEKWNKIHEECDRDCANCVLVQNAEELLEMYTLVGQIMIDKANEEEEEKRQKLQNGWRKWQVNCDPREAMSI